MKTLLLSQTQSTLHVKKSWYLFIGRVILFITLFASPNSYGFNTGILKKQTTVVPMFRIQINGLPNYLDECVVYYQEGASNGFDNAYDAYKIFGPNPAPHISIDNDTLLMAINGIPPVTQTYTTNILATTPVTGNFTITAANVQGLPAGTCVFLKDLQTNTSINLLLSPYSFNLSNTTITSRFVLTITYNTLPTISNLNQPICQMPNGGKFIISGNSNSPWNYVWKDTLGTIVKTNLGLNTSDSLDNLNNGGYKVEITSVGDACLRNEISFNINKVIIPVVSFASIDTITSGLSTNFTPSNLSSNCTNYYWDFGDGIGSSYGFEPNYTYSVAGTNSVKLVGSSNTGCVDSIVKTITVLGLTTFIKESAEQSIQFINTGNNNFQIKLLSNTINELHIEVYDLDGKRQLTERKENLKGTDKIFLNFNSLTQGVYLLIIKDKNSSLLVNKIIIN